MVLVCYSNENAKKCVAESRRRSAWRGRIARSRQDLPIRSLRMRSNTAAEQSGNTQEHIFPKLPMRKAGFPGVLFERGCKKVCCRKSKAKLPKVEGEALGGVESLDLDKTYRSAAPECVRTQRKHAENHIFPKLPMRKAGFRGGLFERGCKKVCSRKSKAKRFEGSNR